MSVDSLLAGTGAGFFNSPIRFFNIFIFNSSEIRNFTAMFLLSNTKCYFIGMSFFITSEQNDRQFQ